MVRLKPDTTPMRLDDSQMFGVLYAAEGSSIEAMQEVALEFSPRIEVNSSREVTIDLSGLTRLFGDARAMGEALGRTAADRGLRVRLAVAGTRTAARLIAHGSREPLTIVNPGDEAAGSPTFKSATYDDKFKRRFLQAQADRNADLLRDAQNLWSDIQAGKAELYPDDMPFVVPGSDGAARMWQADTSLVNCTQKPHIYLTHTGTQNPSPGPICSVRIPSASAEDDDSFASVLKVTVRVWLGAHALRTNGRYDQTKDDITGRDYDSSATSTASNVKGITKPLLIAANSAATRPCRVDQEGLEIFWLAGPCGVPPARRSSPTRPTCSTADRA